LRQGIVIALGAAVILLSSRVAAADSLGTLTDVVPGPEMDIQIERDNVRVPASLVPYTKNGDKLIVKFPFADPRKQLHRFHAIFAELNGIETPPEDHIKQYALFENQNFNKDFIWPIRTNYTPVVLVFPESGNQRGRGAQEVVVKLRQSPQLFAKAATQSIAAAQVRSRSDELLEALRSGLNKDLQGKQERLTLFADDLGIKLDQSCFDKSPAVQTPCLLHSATAQLNQVSGDTTKLVGDYAAAQIKHMVGERFSLYLSIVLDLYAAFRKAHVPASYTLIPGALTTRNETTVLGLDKPYAPESTPAPIAYIVVPAPSTPVKPPSVTTDTNSTTCLHGETSPLPVHMNGKTLNYAWGWRLSLSDQNGHAQNDIAVVPGTDISDAAVDTSNIDHARFVSGTLLKGIVTARWGFDQIKSESFNVLLPHKANWHADVGLRPDGTAILTLTGGPGRCIDRISIRDDSNHSVSVTITARGDSRVTGSFDARKLTPGTAEVAVEQDTQTSDLLQVSVPSPSSTP
jgi:hypothetical protein